MTQNSESKVTWRPTQPRPPVEVIKDPVEGEELATTLDKVIT